jgi:porphobilinogen synthase
MIPQYSYPTTRLRRLRTEPWLRDLVAETSLNPQNLILPIFLHNHDQNLEVPSMPAVFRYR